MFEGLYYCNTHSGKVHSDYIVDGVYFTFTFDTLTGRMYEWNEEIDRRKLLDKQRREAAARTERHILENK